MQLKHLLNNLLGATGITQPPPGHCKSFRKTINQNGSLTHSFNLNNGYMLFFVSQLGINLIRHDEYVMFPDNFRNGFQIAALHNCPGRIIGEWKYKYLGFIRDGLFQFLCR